ncbi:MAG: hypothetical protein K2N63_01335 [Lachnospiraceae bacterium]|nr:hypothetical protein [Lachnospiraceae bacterium]
MAYEEIEMDGLEDVEAANTSIDEIDNENINLIFVGIDRSGSMYPFEGDMSKSLQDFKDALTNSKEADDILVARADFAYTAVVGGYKRITEFDTAYQTGGSTAMFDTIVDGTNKLKEYRDYLKNEGMRVKAVFAIFSDGEDNISDNKFGDAKKAVEYLNNEEIVTAFISFGGAATQIAKDLGFRNILDVNSSASELRKAFNCLSKSVIENSKSAVSKQDDFFDV